MRWIVISIGAILIVSITALVWYSSHDTKPLAQPLSPKICWTFEASQPGAVVAAPLVTDDAVYLAAIHARGFSISGAVYGLDKNTGKSKWMFDHGGDMLATASSPLLLGNRLFFGEGMHQNFVCKFYCVDSITGKAAWTYQTGGHIEGAPVTDGSTIFFPSGDEGVHALDASTGARRWEYQADVHIDSTPMLTDGRVFVGSGPSRKYPSSYLICLDASTGNPVWRTPIELPCWVTPVVANGRVFVGLGNGRLTKGAEAPEVPAGGLACFDAATGTKLWSLPVGDAVFGRPVVVGDRVVFGSRDGNVYGVSFEGRELFRLAMGGPVIAPPEVEDGLVYVVSVPGRIACLDPTKGQSVWEHELTRVGASPQVYAAPRFAGNRLYIAAEMRLPSSSTGIISLFCFDRPDSGIIGKGIP